LPITGQNDSHASSVGRDALAGFFGRSKTYGGRADLLNENAQQFP
jgi:hypothetical protein